VIFLLNFAFKAKSQDSYFFKELKLGFSAYYAPEFIDGEVFKFASHELMLNTNIGTSLTKNMNIGFQNLWFYVQENYYRSSRDKYNIRGVFLQYNVLGYIYDPNILRVTIETSFNKGNICDCDVKNVFTYNKYTKVENLDYIGFGGGLEFMFQKIPLSFEMGLYYYNNINMSSYSVAHLILGLNYTFKKNKKVENSEKINTIKTLD